MASAVDCLAATFANDGSIISPEQKHQTIHVIEDDNNLLKNEHIHAYQIIHKDTTFADMLLTIHKKETCTHYI
jgi:hypothetical protein